MDPGAPAFRPGGIVALSNICVCVLPLGCSEPSKPPVPAGRDEGRGVDERCLTVGKKHNKTSSHVVARLMQNSKRGDTFNGFRVFHNLFLTAFPPSRSPSSDFFVNPFFFYSGGGGEAKRARVLYGPKKIGNLCARFGFFFFSKNINKNCNKRHVEEGR